MVQLTLAQKHTISVLLEENVSKASIAKAIGKNKTTIYSELSRNNDQRSRKYNADPAQYKTDAGDKELCIDYYFARPYHSCERGSNENLNRQ